MRLGFSQDFRIAGWLGPLVLSALVSNAAVADCSEARVALRGDWGTVRFEVEVADTATERSIGLMHRDYLAARSGMLFIYPSLQAVSFWMRNTQISLDMLFVDLRGIVRHIHHQAEPLDETLIFGGDSVLAVLEINGGLAKRLGITEGTQVRHSAFAETAPVWPVNAFIIS